MTRGVLGSSMVVQNGDGSAHDFLPTAVDDALSLLRSVPDPALECQVCVVGAGPAGLILAANLVRFGLNVVVVDDRADQTPVGR